MSLFVIADLHLSLGTDKPMDVFGGNWKDYMTKLEYNWNRTVKENDTVVVPGDISWAMKIEDAFADFTFLNSLNGNKILLRGNHDYWWNTPTKIRKYLSENNFNTITIMQNEAVFAEGFVICGSRGWLCENKMTDDDIKILNREAERCRMSLKAGEIICSSAEEKYGVKPEILFFMHYPLTTQQVVRTNPCVDVIAEYGVKRVFYGHLHGPSETRTVRIINGIEQKLISSDNLQFVPYLIM